MPSRGHPYFVRVASTRFDTRVRFGDNPFQVFRGCGSALLCGIGIILQRHKTVLGNDGPGYRLIRLGTTVLKMVAVSEPFYGVPIVLEGMMQGAGQTMLPLIFNVSCMWGVRICGTFVCTGMLGLGLTSAWGCMIAHNLMLFVLFSICWLRGRWMPGSPLQEKKA